MSPQHSSEEKEIEVAIKRDTIRFTLDMDRLQHSFIRRFSIDSGVKTSVLIRALLYILETDEDLANRVIDEIFSE